MFRVFYHHLDDKEEISCVLVPIVFFVEELLAFVKHEIRMNLMKNHSKIM